jgi:hypothetical protein
MLLKRVVAWCMLSLALTILAPELVNALDTGHYYYLTLLDFWKHFAPTSFAIARMLENSPLFFWAWNPFAVTVLKFPGWGVPFAVSLYFFLNSRKTMRGAQPQ